MQDSNSAASRNIIGTPQPIDTRITRSSHTPCSDGSTSPLTGIKVADVETNCGPEPRNPSKKRVREHATHGVVLGESLKCTDIFMMFENVSSRVPPLNGVVAYCWRVKFSSPSLRSTQDQNRTTDDHLVNQDTQRPPIHGRGVPMCIDDLGCDVFCQVGQLNRCVAWKWKVSYKPSVPTNELVLKSAVQDRVSIKGI